MAKKQGDNISLSEAFDRIMQRRLDKEKLYLEIGKVLTVNESEQTFTYESNVGNPEDEVNMSVIGSETYIVPEVDSVVLIGYTNNTDKYCLHVEKADKIIFRNGANGGLINIVDQTEKLNGLVSKVNALYNLLKNWVVIASDGGLALQTAAKLLSNADNFNKSDYEDEQVTH